MAANFLHRLGGAALLCALLSLAAAPAVAQTALTPWVTGGILTHYGGAQDGMNPNNPSFGTLNGACGYGAIPKDKYPYFSVAALSPSNQFSIAGPLKGCGECFQIQCVGSNCNTGPDGQPASVVVMISDTCPQCEADHIDVQSLSFAKLANPALGRISMQYRRVECTPPNDMKVAVLDYRGAGGWVRLSIDDTGGRGAVQSVQVRTSGAASWQSLKNTWGAEWETSNAPSPPLDFRITTDNGEAVVATSVIKTSSAISTGGAPAVQFSTGVQFSITGRPSTSASASASASGGGSASAFASASASASTSALAGGAPLVAAFEGPPDTAGAPRPEALGTFSAGSCADVPPPGPYTCVQQAGWGRCNDEYYKQNKFCAVTCGFCGGGGGGGGTSSPAPPVAASGGSRKMMRLRH